MCSAVQLPDKVDCTEGDYIWEAYSPKQMAGAYFEAHQDLNQQPLTSQFNIFFLDVPLSMVYVSFHGDRYNGLIR